VKPTSSRPEQPERKLRTRRDRNREYLEAEEVNKLLDAVREPGVVAPKQRNRDYLLLLMMFAHALRVGEALKLRVSDVDLEGRVLHVPRLKNGKSKEQPIKDCLKPPFSRHNEAKAIKAWLADRERMKPETDVFFVSQWCGPLSRQTVWIMFGKVAKAAGLERLAAHPHQMRHSLGYHLINDKGINIRVVMDYMGHRRMESTAIYTEINPKRFNELL
jgi:type 1 fimbriae regulatory protein FimB